VKDAVSRALLFLAVLALAGCGGASAPRAEPESGDARLGPVELVERLREGGLVVYLRHAATDRSKEDAGVLDLDDCSTQRNLDERGREQARAIGEAFRALEIPVGEVRTSEYCRTRETAELAFGEAVDEPTLTGFPGEGDPGYEERLAATRGLLRAAPVSGNTVLVAHIKNIEAAAGISIEEGELAVFRPGDEIVHLGDVPASAWPQLADELGR